MALVPALLPRLGRLVVMDESERDKSWGQILLVSDRPCITLCIFVAAFINLKYIVLILRFMSVGCSHFLRTQMLASWLSILARPVAETHPNIPQLQLRGHHACGNARALVCCVDIVVHFGERYALRVETYVATGLATSLCGLAGVLLKVLACTTGGEGLILMRWVTVSVVWLICISTGMALNMIFHGAGANEAFGQLVGHLTNARWRCRAGIGQTESDVSEGPALGEVLGLAADSVAGLTVTEPVKFAGVKATKDLAYSLFSVVSTAVGFVLSKVLLTSEFSTLLR